MKNIIIGAGPAGRLAGLELGKLSEEVLLIEKNNLGGTCLNEGCMVICALNDIAKFFNNKKRYEDLGIIKGDIDFSYEEIVKKIIKTQKIIHKIDHVENTSVNNEIVYGEAKIHENEVTVNGETWNYEKLLIATGAKPFIPNIPGKEYGITNKDILKLKKVPEKLNILGGSIIAAEVSNIYSSLGSKVNIITRSEFLKELSPQIKEYVVNKLLKNVNIYENKNTVEIQKNKVLIEDNYNNENLDNSHLANNQNSNPQNKRIEELDGRTFIATGRSPNSEIAKNILNSDNFDEKEHIIVNEMLETKLTNVYAAGDVIGGIELTPVARMEGILAARNMAGYLNKIDYNCIPHSIALDMDISFAKTNNTTNMNENTCGNINENINNNSYDGNKKENETNDVIVPGSAGPGGFWKVLTQDTGITKASFNSKNHLLESITAISPSSVSDVAYLSYLMRIGENIENFDEFIEIHPSTDVFFQIMKYM